MPLVAVFLLVAIPVILGAVIWTGWLMWNVVFPEEDEAPVPVEHGESVPVDLSYILERQRRRPALPVMPWHQPVGSKGEAGEDSLARDLWMRRN